MKFLLISIVAVVVLFTASCVVTQDDVGGIYARQSRLERKVDKLLKQQRSGSGESDLNRDVDRDVDLSNQLFQLEIKVYDLERKVLLFEKQADNIKNDVSDKDVVPVPPLSLPALNLPEIDEDVQEQSEQPTKQELEEALFEAADKDVALGNYANARQKFRSFLRQYPNSSKKPDAAFLIADSYYNEGFYEEAILEYQNFIDGYKDDPRVPLAYLRQPLSLIKLNKEEEARLFLQILIDKYPESSEANEAKKLMSEFKL